MAAIICYVLFDLQLVSTTHNPLEGNDF